MRDWIERLDAELGPTWDELELRAREALGRMTSLEKAMMYEAQRVSFVYGNIKLHNPILTREMAQEAADRIDGVVRSTTT